MKDLFKQYFDLPKQLFKPKGYKSEEFKPVTYPGIEPDNYIISNYGRIYTIKTGNELAGYIDEDGYPRITLKRDKEAEPQFKSKLKSCSRHRLVAHEFIPNPDNKEQVNHIDGVKDNTYFENLEWCTNQENGIHAYDTGLNSNKGEQATLGGVYTENQIHEICQMLQLGMEPISILNYYGFKRKLDNSKLYNLIIDLKRRKNWRHITRQYDY